MICWYSFTLSRVEVFSLGSTRLQHNVSIDKPFDAKITPSHCIINIDTTYVLGTYTSFSWRSHTCGELDLQHVGETVLLCGWLQFQRPLKFATLRDWNDVIQLYFPPEVRDH